MQDFDRSIEKLERLRAAASPEALEAIRVKVLGRRGSLTLAMRELADRGAARSRGAAPRRNELNAAKERITAALTRRPRGSAAPRSPSGSPASAPTSPCR